MKALNDIKAMAKKLGIKSVTMKKNEMIQAIQKAEGNIPCFQTGVTACDQSACCWRDECMSK